MQRGRIRGDHTLSLVTHDCFCKVGGIFMTEHDQTSASYFSDRNTHTGGKDTQTHNEGTLNKKPCESGVSSKLFLMFVTCLPSFLPSSSAKRNNTHGEMCSDNTHTHTPSHTYTHKATHSSRRHGQIVSDTLEPSREPPSTSNKGGQKQKSVSHAEALGQLYKTVIHAHTNTHNTNTH